MSSLPNDVPVFQRCELRTVADLLAALDTCGLEHLNLDDSRSFTLSRETMLELWDNPSYPADAPVVVVVDADDTDTYLAQWDAETSLAQTTFDELGIYYTAVPAPRLPPILTKAPTAMWTLPLTPPRCHSTHQNLGKPSGAIVDERPTLIELRHEHRRYGTITGDRIGPRLGDPFAAVVHVAG